MTAEPSRETSSLDGALRWIGDLDHPFYDDERQRFIWYEASLIGLQLTIMLQFLLGGVLMLIMGADAYPFLAVGMLPVVVATTIVTFYAHRRGAPYFVKPSDLRGSRAIFGLLVVIIFAIGGLRIAFDGSSSSSAGGSNLSTIAGAITGAGAVFVMGYIIKRRFDRAEDQADERDF